MAITEVRIHPAIDIARVGPRDFQKCVDLLCPDTPRPQATAVPVADELRRLVDQLQQALRTHQ